MWEGFFDPAEVLSRLGLTADSSSVVDLGCGYGTFTIPATRITAGIVHGFDIEPEMIAATSAKAASAGFTNVRLQLRDFVANGTGLPDDSIGYVMLFNILHAEEPVRLLREAHRILAPGGTAAVVHWVGDRPTPRGPALDIGPSPEDCRAGWPVRGSRSRGTLWISRPSTSGSSGGRPRHPHNPLCRSRLPSGELSWRQRASGGLVPALRRRGVLGHSGPSVQVDSSRPHHSSRLLAKRPFPRSASALRLHLAGLRGPARTGMILNRPT
jgi:SAM-dependent methyltransferase